MQISRKSSVLVLLASAAAIAGSVVAHAAEYYVSPTGSDTSDGTLAAPFATLSKANSAAAAGDTIWVRGGTHTITTQLVLSKSGASDSSRTKIWAYPGETPVLDASKYVTSDAAVDVPVVLVTGSWMHLKGLEISNAKVGASGAHSYSLLRTKSASNNTFELLKLHHGFGPGLFIDTGTGGNLILNCDSHDNYDKDGSQGDGQNGDGFGVHYQKTGPSSIVRGCRAWMDSDDGYDLISQEVPVTVEDSFAFQNGYGKDGNGNGFKMGSSQTGIRHIVQDNVAWKNKAAGFYANHSSGGNTWYNNTSYNNGVQYNMLASSFDASGNITGTIVLTGSKVHILRNNVGFPAKNSAMDGVDSGHNTWDLNLAETAADFASTDPTGCDGPRQADGSMPAACTFMKLKAGSPLVDKGTDVGLPFAGAAPDLGAYEYGALPSTGGAGGLAAGGSPGTGGNSAGGDSGAGDAGAGGILGSGGASSSDAGGGGNAGAGAAGGTTTVDVGGFAVGGGAVASGGNMAAGGMTNSGGLSGAGGSSDAGGSRTPGGASSSGCGCALGGAAGTSHIAILMVVALGLLRRRLSSPRRAQGACPDGVSDRSA
jgi:hypothetical protein